MRARSAGVLTVLLVGAGCKAADDSSEAGVDVQDAWSRPDNLCFARGTLIAMADGLDRAIETIEAGDEVLAYDEARGGIVKAWAVKTFVHSHAGEVVVINGRLAVTAEHPFYANGRWIPAGELSVGDALMALRAADTERVSSLERRKIEGEVYNLEVAGPHNYFAGGFLVHNKQGERAREDAGTDAPSE